METADTTCVKMQDLLHACRALKKSLSPASAVDAPFDTVVGSTMGVWIDLYSALTPFGIHPGYLAGAPS